MRLHWLAMKVLGVVLLFSSAALAQTATGSISGVVKDESAAVIPGATVVVSNVGTGVKRSVATDSAGRYYTPGLDPGLYEVEAQAAGFQTEVRRGIQLTVGRGIVIDVMLRVGQVTEKTVVTAEAPLVETVSNTLSGLVDDRTIRELPLNGRSFDHLIALQPGVHWFRAAGHITGPGTMSEYFTVGGSRTLSNQFLLDGLELVGTGSHSILPGGVLGKNMGVDAIQEYTVLLGNYSAAYGKRNGGIVNIVTRPGTNQLHGSAYEFVRNDNLDARNFFDPNPRPAEFRRNQFGGSAGGPLRRDRTFFFGTYEGLREGLGETNIAIVPDNNARQGLLPDPRNPGQWINVGVAPSIRPYIPVLFGPPNGRNFGDGTAEHVGSPTNVSGQDFFLVRVDHHFSEKDSLFARYNFQDAASDDPNVNSMFIRSSGSRAQSVTLEEKRVYPTTLNLVRVGFTRARSFSNALPITPADSSLRFVEGADEIGEVTFGTGGGSGGAQALTASGPQTSPSRSVLNQLEVSDQVFRYLGRHSLQLGLNVQRIQHNEQSAGQPRGLFDFTSLQNFLLGRPDRFIGAVRGGDTRKSYRRIYLAGFVQDDFKVRPHLTLNLGVRYELMTVPVERWNRISNYRRQLVNGVWIVETNPRVGGPFFKANHDLWAPRVGFAWDPFRDGKTSVRGGFGIFYDQIVSEFRAYTSENLPFYQQSEVDDPPFPLGFSGSFGQAPLPAAEGIDFDLDMPTKLQWSFSIQRQLSTSGVFNIAYVGSHSSHMTRRDNFNLAVPQLLPGGIKFYPAGLQRRNLALSNANIVLFDVNGFYQSLQMDFTQRLRQGLRAKASYTFSKSMDEASSVQQQQALGTSSGAQDAENRRAERGLSSFDSKHILTTNFTYDLPGSSFRGAAGKLIGGWQLGGILSANSGEPFSAQTGFRRSRNLGGANTDRPNLRAGASNNPVLGGPDRYFDPNAFELQLPGFYGNVGRNTMIGPGFVNVDLSLVKNTPVGERLKTEFRAEFFNLFNHANFGLPSLAIFNANGTVRGAVGRVTATANTSRQIQFGVKLSF